MKMNEQGWSLLRYFNPEEKNEAGNPAFPTPYLMESEVMFRLDHMRHVVGKPFIVHCSYEIRKSGQHPLGMAVDGHFVGMTVIEQYLTAEQFGFGGLGFYPYWNNPGIHVDSREIHGYEKASRWWRDKNSPDNSIPIRQLYHPITAAAINQFI